LPESYFYILNLLYHVLLKLFSPYCLSF
jgi:hypothetical protein